MPDTAAAQPAAQEPPGHPRPRPCVRCNLQLEGTGVEPTDVIIDGASDYESNDPEARPHTFHKHVIVRADRADGFVAHNFTVRGARARALHRGDRRYRVDTVKMFWNADYGNLTFTSDHGLYTDCDGTRRRRRCSTWAAPPRPASRPTSRSIRTRRGSTTTVRDCDMRGSVLAYSA